MELEDIVEILKNDPEKAVPELLEDVRKQYGEVPYIMNFMKDFPEIFIPKTLYDNSIMREFKNLDPGNSRTYFDRCGFCPSLRSLPENAYQSCKKKRDQERKHILCYYDRSIHF